MSISYAFHPYTCFDDVNPDLILASSDQVLFYVHFHRLLAASENNLAKLLPSSTGQQTTDKNLQTVLVPESAEVLNIVVHTIYGKSALEFHTPFETLSSALDAVSRYGLSLKRYAGVGQPLYDLVVSSAPLRPIDTYALAAKHDLADAAAAASVPSEDFPQISGLSEGTSGRPEKGCNINRRGSGHGHNWLDHRRPRRRSHR